MIGISRLYCGAITEADSLRYGKGHGGRSTPVAGADKRPVIVFNSTQRCNLRCAHCYANVQDADGEGEMTTEQALAMLEDMAAFGCPVILFSGGEPLARRDLPKLVERTVELGMRAVISTNGMMIDETTANVLGQIGLSYAGVSLDGMRETHDSFRRLKGAFDQTLAGVRNARKAGIKVGFRLTITKHNAGEIGDVFKLLQDEDIDRICFYHLVNVGRGSEIASDDLDHGAMRATMDEIIDRTAALCAAGLPKEVLTVDNHADGPYLYLRMARESHPSAAEALRLLRLTGGNSTGCGIGCVSWDGTVHPDQFWRTVNLGNVLERPFSEIWMDLSNPVIAKLKDKRPHLKGRCQTCRFLGMCGGNLRARAEAATGDPWACDPACYLTDEEIAGTLPEDS